MAKQTMTFVGTLEKCQQAAADCTEEEVVGFIHQKGALIRGKGSEIYSLIGFPVTAVPKCFSGELFRLYREEQRKQREAEASAEQYCRKELEEWRREQEGQLPILLVTVCRIAEISHLRKCS